jgi:septal ring factor EnvC (AmiA/AmiB activator)
VHVTQTSETPSQAEQPASTASRTRSSRKSILALAIFALGLNAAAAVYTMSPADFALPNADTLAALLPHQRAPETVPEPVVVAALKDIQSVQQQHITALQATTSSLEQNAVQLRLDSTTIASLRASVTDEQDDVKKMSAELIDEHADVKKVSSQITDEHVDVKKISEQVATLIAKVDSLQNTMAPAVTSSIPAGHARYRVMHKRIARQPKPVISIGGPPLSLPAIRPQG